MRKWRSRSCAIKDYVYKPSSVVNDDLSRPIVANRLKPHFVKSYAEQANVKFPVLLRIGFTGPHCHQWTR